MKERDSPKLCSTKSGISCKAHIRQNYIPLKRVCGTYCICNLFEKIADIEKFRYIYLSISANAQTNNW